MAGREPSVRVVSVSGRLGINAVSSGETGEGGGASVVARAAVCGLYSHMGPLGLKVLHAGQNLLLVAGQGHAHLSQLTRR